MSKWGCPKCKAILPNPGSIIDSIFKALKEDNLKAADIGLDMKCLKCNHEFDEPVELADEKEDK